MALKEELMRIFADFEVIKCKFNLLCSFFICEIETSADELQVELIV